MKKGSLSINSENIFPVIKKWLYSDHDIFVRELISNGCDAVTKLKKLSLMGEFDEPDEPYRIDVIASPDNKTLQFIDNGIGMTAEEVEKYINQIAFSGAAAFLEQYKDKATEEQQEDKVIIPQGKMRVTVICDGSLNIRRSAAWGNDNICGRAIRGQSYYVKEIHVVDGKKMVRTIGDLYLSGESEHVQFEQL